MIICLRMDFGDLAGILPLYPNKGNNSQDARFKNAELIVPSPYTRVLQTAQLFQGKHGYESKLTLVCTNGYLMRTIKGSK